MKKKVMLPWMSGESWSSSESLKVFKCDSVGVEGLMHFLCNISNSMLPPVLLIFVVSSVFFSYSILLLIEKVYLHMCNTLTLKDRYEEKRVK